MIIIKRDGREANYDRQKIVTAIQKANNEVGPDERVSDSVINEIIEYIESRHRKRMLVEDIQDIIEQKLMADGKFISFIVIRENLYEKRIQQTILF